MIEQELEQFSHLYNKLTEYLMTYSFQVVAALVILILGIWLANKLTKMVFKLLSKYDLDITLTNFICNVTKALFITMVVIIALGKLGVSVTPFVAAIGAASLGIGLALQGMLSNYGAGLAIIATRPFVVGDTISVQGVHGRVQAIKLGMTILNTEDNVTITIPNKHIVGEIIHNSYANSLVEAQIGIAYDSDPDLAIRVITDTLANIEAISHEPKIQVGIESFGDSSVNISYRFWVPTQTLIATKFTANLAIYKALQQAGINIPFPQRVVTLNQATQQSFTHPEMKKTTIE